VPATLHVVYVPEALAREGIPDFELLTADSKVRDGVTLGADGGMVDEEDRGSVDLREVRRSLVQGPKPNMIRNIMS